MSENINLIDVCDKKLFDIAMTHPSYVKDNDLPYDECYERLEFLGDSVLKLLVSEILFKKFPDYDEGRMTKIRAILVSDASLAKVAVKIGLDKCLKLGKGEEKTGGRTKESILACAFEAMLGACYTCGKINETSEFLKNEFAEYIEEIDNNLVKYHAKEMLQEYTQSIDCKLPVYKTEQTGSAHKPQFNSVVYYNDEEIASAAGKTKKESQQNCAYNACVKLGIIKV